MEKLKEEREHLVLENLGLVRYIANSIKVNNIEFEDRVSIGTIGLIKAANTFDESKGIKFSTYSARCIENEILMNLRKENKQSDVMHFEDMISQDNEGNLLKVEDIIADKTDYYEEYQKILIIENILNMALNLEDTNKRNVILLRWAGLTQKQISDIIGLSQSYIARLEKKAIKYIKRYIDKKLICKKICDMRKIDNFYRVTFYILSLKNTEDILGVLNHEAEKVHLKYFEIEIYNKCNFVIKVLAEDSAFIFLVNVLNRLT